MTKKSLHISPDLSLPLTFVTATDGIFASKGMGKSHLAQVAAEELLDLGQVIVAIDPTDAWWGLRSSADGKSEGYPILVIGGDHGDMKLEPEAAVDLAEAVVTERFSCVICTDGLSDTAEIKFVRQFLDTVYRRNRKPLHIFIDEADIFAPQKPFEVEDSRCIRSMSHVVRRGRKKGIGTTIITQRPAELNASVRSQVEMLFVLGMLNNLDIDAVEKWLRLRKKKTGTDAAFALQEEMIESLNSLQQGDAWLWAPRQKIHQRFRARDKRTFDSGATPKPGQKLREAKRLAAVDIERLGASLAAAAERQKANDPRALKARVVELEKQLAKRGEPMPPKVVEHIVEKPIASKAMVVAVERSIDRGGKVAAQVAALADRSGEMMKKAAELIAASALRFEAEVTKLRSAIAAATSAQVQATHAQKRPPSPVVIEKKAGPYGLRLPSPKPTASASTTAAEGKVEPRHVKILTAIAWWESIGLESPDVGGVAFVSGYSPTSSSFEKARGALRTAGLIDYPSPGAVRLTAEGRQFAPTPATPASTEELHRAVIAQLEPRHGKILQPLIEAYPNSLGIGDAAGAAEYSATSASFEKARGKLRSLGLVTYPRPGEIRAADLLFPEAQ